VVLSIESKGTSLAVQTAKKARTRRRMAFSHCVCLFFFPLELRHGGLKRNLHSMHIDMHVFQTVYERDRIG
jgi:hypothetical protein